jgi:hypothetical protein
MLSVSFELESWLPPEVLGLPLNSRQGVQAHWRHLDRYWPCSQLCRLCPRDSQHSSIRATAQAASASSVKQWRRQALPPGCRPRSRRCPLELAHARRRGAAWLGRQSRGAARAAARHEHALALASTEVERMGAASGGCTIGGERGAAWSNGGFADDLVQHGPATEREGTVFRGIKESYLLSLLPATAQWPGGEHL